MNRTTSRLGQSSTANPNRGLPATQRLPLQILVCILAILPCIPSHAKGDNKDINLYMLAPLTGAGARFGESQRNGVLLAINEINASGGLNGRKLKLSVEDTKTEPPIAVTAFTRLSEKRDVTAIFGSAASLDVPAYLPQVDSAGIPHVVPVAVLPAITEAGSKFTFRTALNDKIAAQKMGEFVVSCLGAKKIALLLEDSAFGETGLKFGEKIESLGVKPLTIEKFKRGDIDIKAQLTKINETGATHIQFWGYYSEYALVAKELHELGYSMILMGNQAPVNTKTIELGGSALEGALNVCLFVPTSKDPKAIAFVDEYKATFNGIPDTWAAQSYDAMNLLADAIRRGGTEHEALRAAISSTKDFKGITGTISFSPTGDAMFPDTSIVKIEAGTFEPFGPCPVK